VKIVVISDTHNQHEKLTLPEGDVLVHCGDSCNAGFKSELDNFLKWFGKQPFKHKICIAGNHDWHFFRNRTDALAACGSLGITYLEDQGVTIDGYVFYGSPWQPPFFNWAFNLPEEELAVKWSMIPANTDVLITHGPPLGILDGAPKKHVGSYTLLDTVAEVRPKVHMFGHIHESYGMCANTTTQFVNASICNLRYRPVNTPWVVELTKKE
jgi:Icc-related predicted phosphoesterase